MTTPMPFTRPTTYTHRDWKTEMAVLLTCVAGMRQDLDEMAASDAAVQAGKTHRELVDGCRVSALELMQKGVKLVDVTDGRYLPVFEAIRYAGGHTEVANDKRYHQHD
jgi:hypothetical protein